MKKLTLLALVFSGMYFTSCSSKETEKHSIKKIVKMENKNGEKELSIKTTEDGKTKTEVFKGEEADKKMKELEKHHDEASHMIEKEVVIKEVK